VRLALAFFASGAAGLLFEVLWFRALGRALGNTVWAATVVLTAFMLGIAIGAMLASRWAPRHAGRAFAAAELTVGIAGSLLVWLLPAFEGAIAQGLAPLGEHGPALAAARLLVAFALLLIPTIAMGMTLPLGMRMLADRETTRALGLLYAANTFGACVAPLVAEYLLVPSLGLRGAALAAAGLNVLAATLGMLHGAPQLAPRSTAAARAPWRLLAAAAGAGALALALEVIWFRLLLLHAPATDTTFALMLMVLLAAVALGSAAAPLVARCPPAWIVAATGLAVVLGYRMASPAEAVGTLFRYAVPLMVPTAFLSGILFTLLGAALRSDSADPRPAIGRLTSCNTLGAALGAALAGLLLLPRAGMEMSLFLLTAGYALLTLLFVHRGSGWKSWLPVATAVAGVAFFPFGLMQSHLSQASQVYRAADGSKPVLITEGPVTTLQVLRRDRFGQPVGWRLLTDNYSMSAINRISLRYMQLFAWLPLALHPAPRRALLISYGAGNTAQALLDEPALQQLTVVDLSPEILAASPLLHRERDPLRDARVRLVVDDGRHYLFSRNEQFDIITGEPPPPEIAGVVNLYTSEYFAALAGRLAPGGLATYWLPVNQLEPRGARAVIAAWCTVFPDCSLWAGSAFNWILLGGRGFANRADLGHFARLWENPATAPRIAASGFEHPAQLGAAFLADAAQLREWIAGVPLLTDDHPKRVAANPLPFQSLDEYARWLWPEGASKRFAASTWIGSHWPQGLREQSLAFFDVQPILNGEITADPVKQLPAVDWLLRATQLQIPVYWLLGSDVSEQRILEALPHRREHAYTRGVRALGDRDYPKAAAFFQEAGNATLARYATCRAASAQSPC